MASIDVEFEKDVLAQAIRDVKFVRTAVPVLRSHHFSQRALAWTWNVIAETFARSHEIPDARIFAARIAADFDDDGDREFAGEVLIGLRRRIPKAPRAALDQIRDFVRMATVREAIEKAADGLERGDLDEAEKAIGKGATEARAASLLKAPTSWAATAPERLARYKDTAIRMAIRFPIEELDRATNGGMKPGHLMIVVANTNVGKSAFGVSLGYHGLVHSGCVVIHVTTEETEDEASARYDARFTGIEKSKFLSATLTEDDEKIYLDKFARRGKAIGERLRIYELPPNSPATAVRVLAEQAREEFGPTVPILVVVDSPDHLKPSTRAENYRLEQTGVFWELKAMTVDPTLAPLAVDCTVQAKAETAGKKVIKAEDLAETVNKARIASFIAGLIEGDGPDRRDDDPWVPIEIYISKNRLGKRKKFRCYAVANLGTCEFRADAVHEEGE